MHHVCIKFYPGSSERETDIAEERGENCRGKMLKWMRSYRLQVRSEELTLETRREVFRYNRENPLADLVIGKKGDFLFFSFFFNEQLVSLFFAI